VERAGLDGYERHDLGATRHDAIRDNRRVHRAELTAEPPGESDRV
jgi:hypothetical protein